MKALIQLVWATVLTLFRNRMQVAFMAFVPISVFFTYMSLFARGNPAAVAQFLGPVLVLLSVTHGMYGVGLDLLMMREVGLLLPYRLAPVSAVHILASRLIVNCAIGMLFGLTDLALAITVYGMPLRTPVWQLVVVLCLAILALGTLGMVLFSMSDGMQDANVTAQILFFILFVLSGITAPLQSMPRFAAIVSRFFPTTLLVRTFHGLLIDGAALSTYWRELTIVILFICASTVMAATQFRWAAKERSDGRRRLLAACAFLPLIAAGIWFNG
jgi:ABC-2 type transport system permease protein